MKQNAALRGSRRTARKPGAYKVWFLLFAGAFASLLSPFFLLQTSHAQSVASPYIATNVYNDVVAYAYRNAIALCAQHGLQSENVLDVANGEWFTNDTLRANVTPLIDNQDETRHCSTNDDDDSPSTNFVTSAVKSWGYGADSNIEAVCDLGLAYTTRANGSDCVGGSGDFISQEPSQQDIVAAIDAKRFPDGWTWNAARYYVLYARSLEVGCRAAPILDYNSPDTTSGERTRADNADDQVVMNVVNADGGVTKMIYQLGDGHKRDSKIGMLVSPNRFDNLDNTCQELADLATEHAGNYAQYVHSNPPAEDDNGVGGSDGDEDAGTNKTTCAVEGIGWFVCPVMQFIAKIIDYAYTGVSNLLEVNPISTDTSSPLFVAWSTMRNFANVAFVIVFLIIIYSQITSVGISNYNIKKMLPRLIVAAILVNISYWICAIAVDLSNIAGYSIKSLFDTVVSNIYTTGATVENTNSEWVAYATLILASTAVVYAGLSMLLPVLVGALISIVTALIILAARQALVIILIVLSPLAFVAFLLPNTQGLFTSWRKIFQTLLLMFPIIALIFGGSALASQIIQQNVGSFEDDPIGYIFLHGLALAVQIIPLFVTVFIQKILQAAGGVLGRITGMVNDPTKGGFDRLRRGAEGMRDRQQMRRATWAANGRKVVGGGRYTRKAKRDAARAGVETEYKRSQAAYVANEAKTDEDFRKRLAGAQGLRGASPEAMSRAMANAINVQASLEADEVKADHAIIKDANLDNDIQALQTLAMGGTHTTATGQKLTATPGSSLQTAAIQRQMEIGDIEKTDQLVAKSGSMGVPQRQAIADGLGKLSSKAKYYGGGASAKVAAGQIKDETDLNKLVADSVEGKKWSAEGMAKSADPDALKRLSQVAADPNAVTSNGNKISQGAINALRDAAEKVSTDPMITQPEGRILEKIQAIEYGVRFP